MTTETPIEDNIEAQLPFPEPIEKAAFAAKEDFDVEKFLLSQSGHQTLQDIKDQLKALQLEVSEQLADVVNASAPEFVQLGHEVEKENLDRLLGDSRLDFLSLQQELKDISRSLEAERALLDKSITIENASQKEQIERASISEIVEMSTALAIMCKSLQNDAERIELVPEFDNVRRLIALKFDVLHKGIEEIPNTIRGILPHLEFVQNAILSSLANMLMSARQVAEVDMINFCLKQYRILGMEKVGHKELQKKLLS
ncbi:hypothetical protein CANCADRAFT_3941 [Tortispora caseinolytica NRRL Y-17796]|uniref:Conserved oligomeric Golgi complex subunit 2 n=1 Tax=Tortispora caseinolytica NRRL Y-17796 TaxID=767744 RepID=A0A1E4TC33_9ASCO|nr:hypothetical protein CANCADRAFT_3941 [Tortispora caseinolytica NRRL Y-17796]